MNSHTHVTGKFLVPVGSEEKPLSGDVSFIAKADSIRGDGKIYLPAPVTVQLDESGAFAVDLLVPSDGLQPSAWSWEAVPSLSYEGAMVPWCSFFFDPAGKAEVDLSEVAPVPDPVTGEYVTRGETGPAPELSIGEVVTVGPGEEAVTITGPAEAPTLDFALPRGRLGWTGDRGPQGIPGPAGPAGPTGASITSISAEDATFNITMSDGITHRLPFPAGVLSAPAPFTLRADQEAGIGYASGSLAWVDRGDGTGVLAPAPGARLSFTATAHELPAGDTPTVEVTGIFPDFELAVGVPAGPAGKPGAKGDKGDSVVGPMGPKGEPGNPGALVLVGVGRPDIPSTLSPENRTAVASALVGATFTSTDGAGTGAWAWIKTPTGWQVTYGDTGRIRAAGVYSPELLTDSRSLLTIRRIGNTVTVGAQLIGPKLNTRMHIEMPPGFQPPSGGMHAALTFQVAQQPAFPAPWGNGRFRPMMSTEQEFWGALDTATNKQMYVGGTFHTSEPWPTTLPSKPTF